MAVGVTPPRHNGSMLPDTSTLEFMTRNCAYLSGVTGERWQRLLVEIRPLFLHAPEHYDHSLRVGIYAWMLAVDEGLDSKLALYGGCAHDVGKCCVSLDVLRAEEFGAAERKAIQSHPGAGAEMLGKTHLFSSFIAAVRSAAQRDLAIPSG